MVQIGKLKNEREISRNFAGTTGLCHGTVPGKRGHVVTLHKRGKASLMGKDLNVSSLPAARYSSFVGQSLILFLWTLLCASFDGGGKGRGNQHLLPGLLSLEPSGLRELSLCELGSVHVLSDPRPDLRSGADGFSSSIPW